MSCQAAPSARPHRPLLPTLVLAVALSLAPVLPGQAQDRDAEAGPAQTAGLQGQIPALTSPPGEIEDVVRQTMRQRYDSLQERLRPLSDQHTLEVFSSDMPGEAGEEGQAGPDDRMAEQTAEQMTGLAAGHGSGQGAATVRGVVENHLLNELVLRDGQPWAIHEDGHEHPLPPEVYAVHPVLGSDMFFLSAGHGDSEFMIPRGVYLFRKDGTQTGYIHLATVNPCIAAYLSPDRTLLAVDMGGPVNHNLLLYRWPDLASLDIRLRYYVPEGVLIGAQNRELERRAQLQAAEEEAKKEAEQGKKRKARKARTPAKPRYALRFEPLAWYNGHNLLYRILNTDTARPCGYEPCGVLSVRTYEPDRDNERVVCAGTELCDCALFDLTEQDHVPVAEVGMQCTSSISAWRTHDDKKTTLSLQMPLH